MNIALNADCMEVMRQYPDQYFDLAVVDPPYGDGGGSFNRGTRFGGKFDKYKPIDRTGRTFVEVEQPESDFLLRISERGEIGVYPADGGVWKLEATRNIAGYFEEALKDLIESGSVVVIR